MSGLLAPARPVVGPARQQAGPTRPPRRAPLSSGQPVFNPPAGLNIAGTDYTTWLVTRSPRLRSTLSPYTGTLNFRLNGYLPFAQTVLGQKPVGYWKCDDTGGQVTDYSGNGNHGGVVGGVTYGVDGPLTTVVDRAIQLDGATGFVVLNASPILNPATFTLEAACKFSGALATNLSVYDQRGGASGFALSFETGDAGKPKFWLGAGGGLQAITGPVALNDGKWHLIRCVYDGTLASMFVDGVLVAGPTALPYVQAVGIAPWIGRVQGNPFFFPGAIGQVSLVPSAQTADAVVRNTCLAGMPGIPQVEQEITWSQGSVTYAGRIRDVVPQDDDRLDFLVIEVACQDHTTLLDLDIAAPQLSPPQFNSNRSVVESDQQRIEWLLDSFGRHSITTRHVQNLYPNVPAADYTGQTLSKAIAAILAFSGGSFYVDYAKDLHTFLDEQRYAPFSLDDLPNGSTTFGYKDLVIPADSIELRNAVYAIPGVTVLNPDIGIEAITTAQAVQGTGCAAIMASFKPASSSTKLSLLYGAIATAAGASVSPAFSQPTTPGTTLLALVVGTTAGGTGNFGQTGAATFSYDFSGANTDNVVASGPYTIGVHGTITSLSVYFGGYTAAVNARLCIWRASDGALVAQSSQFSCPQGRATRTQGISLDAPSGTQYYIGFWRDKSKDATWGVRSSGTFATALETSPGSRPTSGCGAPYACGEMQAYATYSIVGGAITTAQAGWVLAGQQDSTNEESQVWYKRGADTAGNETAPTFTGTSGTNLAAQLIEVFGLDSITPLDQLAGFTSAQKQVNVTMPNADAGFGDLIVLACRWPLSVAGTATFADTLAGTSGAVNIGNTGGTSTTRHASFSYGILLPAGAVPTWYENAASIAAYGRKEASFSNSQITSQDDLDALGAAYLADFATPRQQGTLKCWQPGLGVGQRVSIASRLQQITQIADPLGNYTALIQAVDTLYDDDVLPVFTIEFAQPTITMAVQFQQLAAALSASGSSGTSSMLAKIEAYRFRAHSSLSQSITSIVDPIQFDQADYDPSSGYDTTAYTYTVPLSGYYLLTGVVMVAQNSVAGNNRLRAFIMVNGAESIEGTEVISGGANSFPSSTIADVVYLNQGDKLRVACFFNAGAGGTLYNTNSASRWGAQYLGNLN